MRDGLRFLRSQCQAQQLIESTEHLVRLRVFVLVGLPRLLLSFEEIVDGNQCITDLLLLPSNGSCFVGRRVFSGRGSAGWVQQGEEVFIPTSEAGEPPCLDHFRRDAFTDSPVESLSLGLHGMDF